MLEHVYIEDNPEVYGPRMKDMRLHFGYEEDDTTPDKQILSLNGADFLDEWLKWNGIIGYTDLIIDVIYSAYGIDLNSCPFDRDIKRQYVKGVDYDD